MICLERKNLMKWRFERDATFSLFYKYYFYKKGEHMNKTSKFKLILYMIFSNLFLFIALTSDYTLSIMKNNTWYSPIFVFLGYIFLILIIPTNNKHLIKKVYSQDFPSIQIFIVYLLFPRYSLSKKSSSES